MDKYDEAIEFLQSVDPGSYFDECAALMEELLAQVELSKKPKRQRYTDEELAWMKQMDGGARYYAKAKGLL